MFKSIYRFEDKEPVLNFKGVLCAVALYPVYIVLVPQLAKQMLTWFNQSASLVDINLLTYIITAVIALLIFGRFLWDSAKAFFRSVDSRMIYVPVAAVVCTLVGNALISRIIQSFAHSTQSENNASATLLILQNPAKMIIAAVFLAPLIEELIFRAAFFRPIWFKFKTAAVILGIVLFGLHHVWQSVVINQDLYELIFILQYLPSTLAMIFGYCMMKNTMGSIFIHMTLNSVSVVLITFAGMLAAA